MAMQESYDPYRHLPLVARSSLPKVEENDAGKLVVDGGEYSKENSSGDFRARAHIYLALAEHQKEQEARAFRELDAVARRICETPYVSLNEHDRAIVQAVHEQYILKPLPAFE